MKLEQDKILHIGAGTAITLIWFAFTTNLFMSFLIATLIGAGKEMNDWITKKGKPEFDDFLATIIGSILGIIIITLYLTII